VELRRFLTILIIAVVIILTAAAWFLPSNEDFRADNPSWNGVEDISSGYQATPLESLSDLPPAPQGSTLILIPYLDFTPAELEELRCFVSQGGTLVLADDYGYGNRVLEYLGLRARFSGEILLDPMSHYKNKWFPLVSHIIPSPITSNTESLVLNHATCLTDVDPADVLALSSVLSFLDSNGNGSYDEGEPAGPLPVIACHNLGSGQIILISDPSIFINGMESIGSNHTLMENIAHITPTELFIDQSHLPPSNLHQTKSLLAAVRHGLSTPPGAAGLVVVALTVTLMPIWHKKRTGADSQTPGEGDDIGHKTR